MWPVNSVLLPADSYLLSIDQLLVLRPQWSRKLKMLLWGPLVCPAGRFSTQTLFADGFTASTGPLFFIVLRIKHIQS